MAFGECCIEVVTALVSITHVSVFKIKRAFNSLFLRVHELTLPLKDENTLDEQMGFVLMDLRLTLRNGDSKKGIVWET